MTANVKVKYFTDKAKMPAQSHPGDAGWDLFSAEDSAINPGETVMVHTGIGISLPEGTFGGIYARSGLATKCGLRPANCVGICDSQYIGEYIVPLHNDSSEVQEIHCGDRIAQLIVQPYVACQFNLVSELEETERGASGFGSSGV